MIQTEKHYAVLAPMMALAGIFAHPVASTVLPLLLFFVFYWRRMTFAQLVALRAADLAFSIQLYIVLSSVLLAAYLAYQPNHTETIHSTSVILTFILLGYFIASLVAAIIQAFRGKAISYYLSLRIAERVFNTLQKRQGAVNHTKPK